MVRGLLLGLTLCVWGSAAFSSECLKIEPPLDRLACYDKEVGRTPSVVATPTKSDWVVETETSKLTDDKNVFLYLTSKEPVSCKWKQGQKAFLTIRCREKTTAAILSTECHMSSSQYDRYGEVDYRVDEAPAKVAKMEASTNNTSLGLWRGANAIPFVKQLLGGKVLIMRYTPYGDSAMTSEFNIVGLDEAIKPLREACNW